MADMIVGRVMSFTPHNDGFPFLSRDWEDVDCKAETCLNNRLLKCGTPSLAKLNDEGRCTGFHARPIHAKRDPSKID